MTQQAAQEMLRITAQAFAPLAANDAAPMPLQVREQLAQLRRAYRKKTGVGYVDAENQEWFRIPRELRRAILLMARVRGDLAELAERDWRETPPTERAAIKYTVRAMKRHMTGAVALASLW